MEIFVTEFGHSGETPETIKWPWIGLKKRVKQCFFGGHDEEGQHTAATIESSEVLAFIFLYNAATAGDKYAGPKFIRAAERFVRKRELETSHQFSMGKLPDDPERLIQLEKYVSNHLDLFAHFEWKLLKLRVTKCLSNRFTSDEMRGPLKVILSGYVATPSLDPNTVAVELYDLARRENRVHLLIDQMMKFIGRERAVRDDLLAM